MLLTPTSNYSSPINQSHQEITKFPQKNDESKGCKMKIGRLYYQSACCFGRLEGLVWKVTWPDCLKVWLGRSHDQTVAWPGLAGHMARLFEGLVGQVT